MILSSHILVLGYIGNISAALVETFYGRVPSDKTTTLSILLFTFSLQTCLLLYHPGLLCSLISLEACAWRTMQFQAYV